MEFCRHYKTSPQTSNITEEVYYYLFLFICSSIYFYPCEYFSRTSYLGVSVILFFSFIFFLFDEDVFLNSVVSVHAKVPSFSMNMAITRFTVSKVIS